MSTEKTKITWKETCDGVDFRELAELLNKAFDDGLEPVHKPGWAEEKKRLQEQPEGGKHTRGFTAEHVAVTFPRSYAVVFAYDGAKLIAAGRALSDGIEQAAVYNIAVDPAYQGYGLGRAVIDHLLAQVPGCEVILYTHPQTVKFYEALGWRRQKTGFVTWAGGTDPAAPAKLEEMGFILPEGYRYEKDESDYYEDRYADRDHDLSAHFADRV